MRVVTNRAHVDGAADPLSCVATGTGLALEHMDSLEEPQDAE